MIFKALEECLKSNSIEIAKSCLVIATWLVYMLYSLPDTGVRDAARKCLLDQFINVLQSSKNLEEKILVTLALSGFTSDPGKIYSEKAERYFGCLYVFHLSQSSNLFNLHCVKLRLVNLECMLNACIKH